MSRYQQADAAAASVLVRRLSPQLLGFFTDRTRNRADAEDMLQDLWLRIHRVRHAYRPGEPVLPWVYTIARKVRIDNYRRRHRIESWESAVEVLPEPRQRRSAATGPLWEDLMAPLSDRQRRVLTMLKADGMSIEEVARAATLTAGAVKQVTYRAYRRLRQVFCRTQASSHG